MSYHPEVCEPRLLLTGDPPNTLSISGLSTSVESGDSVTCSGAFSDNDIAMHSFTQQWTVTDTSGVVATGSGPSLTFTAGAAGNYTVSYTVTDNDDMESSDPATMPLTVTAGAPPSASISGPTLASAGDLINLYGTYIDAHMAQHTFTESWSVTGPSSFSGTTGAISFTPTATGTYSVAYTVTDNQGPSSTATYSVVVGSLALQASLDTQVFVTPGGDVTLSGTISDSFPSDNPVMQVAWGDGTTGSYTPGTGSFSLTHNYGSTTSAALLPVSATVTSNVLPTASALWNDNIAAVELKITDEDSTFNPLMLLASSYNGTTIDTTYHQAATEDVDVIVPSGYSGPSLSLAITSNGSTLWNDEEFGSPFSSSTLMPATGGGLHQVVYVDPAQGSGNVTATLLSNATNSQLGEEQKNVGGQTFSLGQLPSWLGGAATKAAIDSALSPVVEQLKQAIDDKIFELEGTSDDWVTQATRLSDFKTNLDSYVSDAEDKADTLVAGKVNAVANWILPPGSNAALLVNPLKTQFANGAVTVAPDVIIANPLTLLSNELDAIANNQPGAAEAAMKDPSSYFQNFGAKFTYLQKGLPAMQVRLGVADLSPGVNWFDKTYTLDVTVYQAVLPSIFTADIGFSFTLVPSRAEASAIPNIRLRF